MLMKNINTSTRFSIVDILCERSMPTHYRCVIKKQLDCSYKENAYEKKITFTRLRVDIICERSMPTHYL